MVALSDQHAVGERAMVPAMVDAVDGGVAVDENADGDDDAVSAVLGARNDGLHNGPRWSDAD